jgi:predicted AAA+ superfamily ATPase
MPKPLSFGLVFEVEDIKNHIFICHFYSTSLVLLYMYDRSISDILLKEYEKYPVLAILGPRQTGKTTLARNQFSRLAYVSMEDPDTRRFAIDDPRGFFKRFDGSLIIDEVQKSPDLLSYIQTIVDQPGNKRKFILTGSESLVLSEKISQSLAGRIRMFTLLPLTLQEVPAKNLNERILNGGYPRPYDQGISAPTWLAQYYATYISKDVRQILNLTNLDDFDRVVRLFAGRSGQLLNLSNLSNDAGVSAPTVKAWLSVLKSSYICFTLEPHYKNFSKRIIKSPKVYFYDTGLLCYLLRIKTVAELETHPLYGNIFENFVISERLKKIYNQGDEPNLYFWRDQKGHEIDLIEDRGTYLFPIEIKSSMTFHSSFVENLQFFNKLQKRKSETLGEVVYSGAEGFKYKEFAIRPWSEDCAR